MNALELVEKLINSDYEIHNQRTTILDKLKRLHTPTKLSITKHPNGLIDLCCPRCGRTLKTFYQEVLTVRPVNYCHDCGQRLDWSWENDSRDTKSTE